MTDQLDSRVTGTVTAVMDDDEHPIRRSTYTPVEGVAVIEPAAGDSAEIVVEPSKAAIAPTPDADLTTPSEAAVAPLPDEAVSTPSKTAVAPAPDAVSDEAPETPPDRGFPLPPERGSLDDEHLVPLVGRHTDDTATIDLIGILQAQLQLRATEAARFAAWEQQVREIGTDEALDELERTRLHFTGVIPIPSGALPIPPSPPSARVVTVDEAPTDSTALPIEHGKGPAKDFDVIPAGTMPADDLTDRARTADAVLLDRDDASVSRSASKRAVTTRSSAQVAQGRGTSILLTTISVVAVLVVIAALVLTGLGASGLDSAVMAAAALAAIAVVAAAWIGIVVGRFAASGRTARESSRTDPRTPWALVAGLVVGAVVGEGLVRGADSAFAWQGYLLRLTGVQGLSVELSLVVGLVAAVVIAFAVVVLVDRVSPTTADATARETP